MHQHQHHHCPPATFWGKFIFILMGLGSLVWFILRTGTKPSRINYPCQQLARYNIYLFGIPILTMLVHKLKWRLRWHKRQLILISASVLLLLFFSLKMHHVIQNLPYNTYSDAQTLPAISKVVKVTNQAAASNYFQSWANKANQTEVNKMMDSGIMLLTDTISVNAAWTTLFQQHNGGADYQSGEKIAIKVNSNNQYPDIGKSCGSGGANDLHCPLYQTVNALLRQLVQKGVLEENIGVYDFTRNLPPYLVNGIHASFPNVRLNPDDAGCDPYAPGHPQVLNAGFSCWLVNSKYLINMPLLRTHTGAGVTVSFKNHLGSTVNPGVFHSGVFVTESTNSLYQLNNHPQIKDKTILSVDDALYGMITGGPWGSPNLNPIPNSLFFSTDPVAMDSVIVDFLQQQPDSYIWQNDGTKNDPRKYMWVANELLLGRHSSICPAYPSESHTCNGTYSNINLISAVCDPNCPNGTPNSSPSPSPTVSPSSSPSPSPLPGDINRDHTVNATDLKFILTNFIGSTVCQTFNCDVSGDGKVNLLDAAYVIKYFGQTW